MKIIRIPAGLSRLLWISFFGITCCATEAADGDSAFFAWRRFTGDYSLGYNLYDHRDQDITRETVSAFKIGQPLFFTTRLSLDLGLGAEYWYSTLGTAPYERFVRFNPGVDRAYFHYENEVSSWKYSMNGGLFPFAANPDADVFGDYLLRYGAYPGFIERTQPGWSDLGNTPVPLSGIDLNLITPSGKFQHQFLGLVDSSASGQGKDYSLVYILNFSATENVELGFGMEWLRFASTRPDETTPNDRDNAYVKTDTGYVLLLWDTTGSVVGDMGFYTRTATQIMVRAAFNLQGILGLKSWGKKDWRVYGEAALLGIANQPIYYDDRFRRCAFMTGINLPSFGWLDRFEIAAEWHQPHFSNSDYYRSVYGFPFNSSAPFKDPPEYWKESVFISKSIFHWLSIQGQYIHYPVNAVYAYSNTGKSEATYAVKTLLFDRLNLRLQGYF